MTNPDFRALCAELLDWAERTSSHYYKQADVILRARTALAQTEPPTLKERALEALDRMDQFPNIEDRLIVRRALEALND